MALANGNLSPHIGEMSLKPSRRGLVPPFIAMDVLRAANAREAAGERVIHLEVGQPGTPAPKRGARSGAAGARRRPHRLYRRRGDRAAARGDRRALSGAIRGCGRPRRDRRHHRIVGGVPARVSRRVRTRRPGRARRARLSRLSQHPFGARARDRADRGRRERALPAQPRAAGRHPRSRRAHRRQPGQPDRHNDRARRARAPLRTIAAVVASASSPTRFITASSTMAPRRPPGLLGAKRSSSTRSRSTTA